MQHFRNHDPRTPIVQGAPPRCGAIPPIRREEHRFVQVRFYATLRPLAGGRSLTVRLPEAATVQALVEAVVEQRPALAEVLLDPHGAVPRGVHVFVNGRGTGHLPEGTATRLAEDDRVDIFPAVAGG
jgi:molybdopterin synthase sulfur carrier subunit